MAGPSRLGRLECRGFSLLELVISVCLIAVLATVAAENMVRARVYGEGTGFEATVSALRSGLGIRVARHIAENRLEDLPRLAGANPMENLAELPENYRGVFYGIDPNLIEGGQWYFDSRDGTLVYRVRYEELFETRLPGPARIRLAIVPVFEDRNGNGRFDATIDVLNGMRLEAREAYRWFDRISLWRKE